MSPQLLSGVPDGAPHWGESREGAHRAFDLELHHLEDRPRGSGDLGRREISFGARQPKRGGLFS